MKKSIRNQSENNSIAGSSKGIGYNASPIQEKIDNSQRIISQHNKISSIQINNNLNYIQCKHVNKKAVDKNLKKLDRRAAVAAVAQRRLPVISNDFINKYTTLAKEILLNTLDNLPVDSTIKEDYKKIYGRTMESAIQEETDTKILTRWENYIRENTSEEGLFKPIINKYSVGLNPKETEEIQSFLKRAYEGVLHMQKNIGSEPEKAKNFIRSIFGPDCKVDKVQSSYKSIGEIIFKHMQAKTAPMCITSIAMSSHNDWVGVAGMAEPGAERFEITQSVFDKRNEDELLILNTIVHEISHIVDESILDRAYSLLNMSRLTTESRMTNAETYSQAFLEMLTTYTSPIGKSDTERYFNAEKVAKASVKGKQNDIKEAVRYITNVWQASDEAFHFIKKYCENEDKFKLSENRLNTIKYALHPHEINISIIKTFPDQLQALLEDRTKSIKLLKNSKNLTQRVEAELKKYGINENIGSLGGAGLAAVAISCSFRISIDDAKTIVSAFSKL